MHLLKGVSPHLSDAFLSERDPVRLAHLSIIAQALDGKSQVVAGTKPLNRYSVQPGKTFAASPTAKKKFKVLRVLADDVVVQDLETQKIQTFQVDHLLSDWSKAGIQEVSLLSDIIQTVKAVLGPALGIFLTTALIQWLTEKIGK